MLRALPKDEQEAMRFSAEEMYGKSTGLKREAAALIDAIVIDRLGSELREATSALKRAEVEGNEAKIEEIMGKCKLLTTQIAHFYRSYRITGSVWTSPERRSSGVVWQKRKQRKAQSPRKRCASSVLARNALVQNRAQQKNASPASARSAKSRKCVRKKKKSIALKNRREGSRRLRE